MDSAFRAAWAERALMAFDRGVAITCPSAEIPDLDPATAMLMASEIMALRIARGETPCGWKIGFTNREIWDHYGVHAPIWGPMYERSMGQALGPTAWPVSHLHEPRIEAEIAFRMARTPTAGMELSALLDCVEAVCHGVEIVTSPYPGWLFRPVDTMACGALHGNYIQGTWAELTTQNRAIWLQALEDFSIRLMGSDGTDDTGHASNVLGGPLHALGHFVEGLPRLPHGRGILPGDIITTGTVAKAFPVAAGQIWRTDITGLPLPGLELHLT